MAESEQHAALVAQVVAHIRKCHEDNTGLSILVDSRSVPPPRRPGRIGGFTPDVLVRTVPSSFVIIGEAKSFTDFFVPHTANQLATFIAYLKMQHQPQLIVAIPLAASGAAHSLVRRLKTQLGAQGLPVQFLIG